MEAAHHHDEFERDYWGTCCNTFDEEQKHYVYARLMALPRSHYSFILDPPRSVLDIGGGPASMLLKCRGLTRGKVVDPLTYPEWTVLRYAEHNVEVEVLRGEDVEEQGWDEVWIYNCLQHTDDPRQIIQNAKRAARKLRIFEWIDIPPHEGHPWMLTEALLNEWTGGTGATVTLRESGCFGKAYFLVMDCP